MQRETNVANLEGEPEAARDMQDQIGVDRREAAHRQRLPHQFGVRERRVRPLWGGFKERTQVQYGDGELTADAPPGAAEADLECPGELRSAEHAAQITQLDGGGADERFAGECGSAEVRQFCLQELLDLGEVLGACAEVKLRSAPAGVERPARVQACAAALEVEREGPRIAPLLKQLRGASLDVDHIGEGFGNVSMQAQLKRLTPLAHSGELIQVEALVHVRAIVVVLEGEVADRCPLDFDGSQRRPRTAPLRSGGGARRRGPVRAAVRRPFEANVPCCRLEAVHVQAPTQCCEQVEAHACLAEGGKLRRGEPRRIEDADTVYMYRGLSPKLKLKRTVERHLATERDASLRSERVAPARGIDRHTEDRHPGDDDEKDGQRQADEGDERGDDATPRAHDASLITALACGAFREWAFMFPTLSVTRPPPAEPARRDPGALVL